jgi:hypothetical protein
MIVITLITLWYFKKKRWLFNSDNDFSDTEKSKN